MRKKIKDINTDDNNIERVDFDTSGDDFTLQKAKGAALLLDRLGIDKTNVQMNGDGTIKWDPEDPDYFNQPLKCDTENCKNFPMWKCDHEKMFMRNIQFQKKSSSN